MNDRVLFIANPHAASGKANSRVESAVTSLRDMGVEVELVITHGTGHAIELAREAVEHFTVVVAAGGDGTMNEVATGLLLSGQSPSALGLLPLGTGNDLAYELKIRDAVHAMEIIQKGRSRTLDAIEVRCHRDGASITRHAMLYAGVGFAGELLKRTTPRVKRWFGPRFCYSMGFLLALGSFRAPEMKVRCDERRLAGRKFLVTAGNTEVVGGRVMRLSPGAKPDDGRMEVNMVEPLNRIQALRCFPRLIRGTHTTLPWVDYSLANRVTVETSPTVEVQADGELVGFTPVEFVLRPRAIRVLAPE